MVVADGCCTIANFAAGPATPVAETETAVRLSAVTLTEFAPAVVPRVSVVLARPLASVIALVGATLPPPLATAKPTGKPATGRLSDARTSTTNGCPSAAPAVPVCPSPLINTSAVGTGTTVTVAEPSRPVGKVAVMTAVPRLPEG